MNNFTSKQQGSYSGRLFAGGAFFSFLSIVLVFVMSLLPANLLAKDGAKSLTSTRAADPQPVAHAEYDKTTKVLTFTYGAPSTSSSADDNLVVVNFYDPETNGKWFNGNNTVSWPGTVRDATSVVIDESFKSFKVPTCKDMFSNFKMLTSITGLDFLDTSEATSMSNMFYNCYKLTSLNLSNFNTAKVTGMTNMFYNCYKLTSLDLSNFNTAKVTGMSYMFYSCWNLTSLDLSSFNTANVPSMSNMFYSCSSLASLTLSDKFTTDKVNTMECMFSGCQVLTSLDLSSFNTANVTNMHAMFRSCNNMASLTLSDKFTTDKVTTMWEMFSGCKALTSLNLSKFNTASVKDMNSMFDDCSALTSLDLSNFNTDNVTDMNNMFKNCRKLESLNLSSFTTDEVTKMQEMFSGCQALTSLDLSGFNTANVTNMESMFYNCKKIENLKLSAKFNTSKVKGEGMVSMFYGCSALTSLDLSSFNTANVTSMVTMFSDCSALKSLDLSSFNTANVTSMRAMFTYCSALGELNLSNFNTANVTDMAMMFNSCSFVRSIDLSSFNTSNVTNMYSMFGNCESLSSLDLTSFNTSKVTDMTSMFSGCKVIVNIYVSEDFTTAALTSSGRMSMFSDTKYLFNYDGTTDATHAHYNKGGYFTTYFKNGNERVNFRDGNLTVDNLTLVDNKDFVAYAPFTAANVSYNRTVTDDARWATLCLPFDVSLEKQNFSAYTLSSVTDNVVDLQQLENSIPAGTPVLVKMNKGETTLSIVDTDKTIVRTALTTDGENCRLVGLYERKVFDSTDTDSYILKGDKLMNPAKLLQVEGVKKVGTYGFRAYMVDKAQTSLGANMFSLGISGETTDIGSVTETLNGEDAEYYDLRGHHLNEPQHGINIVKRGGKTMKLIIK